MSRITQYKRGDLVFDVIDSGPEDGTPIILLHGFPQRAGSWEGVAKSLHRRGFRTYAPDQRGYSPGARPTGRFDYRASELAADVTALIDEIGQPVHIAGHDWGAVVAWAVAAWDPRRVMSLTAISVGHPAAIARSLHTQAIRSWYMAAFQLPVVPEALLSGPLGNLFFKSWGMTPDMLGLYKDEIVKDGALPTALHWYRSLPLEYIQLVRSQVKVPTTMIWPTGDVPLGRAQAERSAAIARKASVDFILETVDGSHFILDEQPREVAKIIAERVKRA